MLVRVNIGELPLVKNNGGKVVLYGDMTPEAWAAIAQYMAIDGEAWSVPAGLDAAMGKHFAKYDAYHGKDNIGTAEWDAVFKAFLPHFVSAYGDKPFGYVELPTSELKTAVMVSNGDMQSDWKGDWEAYHAWYRGCGFKHAATAEKPWPVILSDVPDELLQDGWNRFHRYVDQGREKIPAVWFLDDVQYS